MSFTFGKIKLEDLPSDDEEDASFVEEAVSSSSSHDEDEPATKKLKTVEEKEKVLSLVDDLWASLQEGPSDTTSKPSLPPSINPASLTNTKRNVITIPPLQSAPTPSTAVTPILNNNSNSTLFASSSIVNTNAPKSLAEELGQPPEEKKTFKFAGELIHLTETEAKAVGAKAGPAKQGSNVGALLDSLKGKKKITTMQKSTLDWGKYKKDEKLEAELDQQRKDGFLEKQAFLQRTDVRQFENEREARLKERQVNYKKSLG